MSYVRGMTSTHAPPRYPRDLHGHGAAPPDPRWPGGARIAVQVVVNYEEGGENAVLHGDPASEAFLSEISGAEPWLGERHWNMESIYEYGARAGFWRIHRLLREMDVPATVFGVATALMRSPAQTRAMIDAGWEVASHGLKWIEHRHMDEAEERAQMREAIRLHEEVTGARPQGWYTGRCSAHTVRLAAGEGFAYLADSYADDLPYWVRIGGRDQLIVPYTLDANDMRFAVPAGFGAGPDFEAYLRDSFDALYAEGAAGAPRMMSVGLHCRLAGRPGRIMALRRFLEHARSHEGVWFATRLAIAEHWAREHPPRRPLATPPEPPDAAAGNRAAPAPEPGPAHDPEGSAGADRPTEMDREAFVARFGGVFEHSPWIAERAWAMELGPTHDTAAGLHGALVRAFRSASERERVGVLTAHPDLAGKLAQARRLTAESTAEQAGAGLDTLSDDQRAAFERLNADYMARHGFPFIIAVRDHDRAGILAAFQRRLEQGREAELAEASRQVERIAELRLRDMLP